MFTTEKEFKFAEHQLCCNFMESSIVGVSESLKTTETVNESNAGHRVRMAELLLALYRDEIESREEFIERFRDLWDSHFAEIEIIHENNPAVLATCREVYEWARNAVANLTDFDFLNFAFQVHENEQPPNE